ncbi:MAG: arginine deiminase-related protein [Pseudomonadota bacterium]
MVAQSTSTVLMVRPVAFQSNPLTAASNSFQNHDADAAIEVVQAQALGEFEGLVAALQNAGVEVIVVDDKHEPHTPDAVFPNNWISTHSDGTVVTYPMMANNRRLERRRDVMDKVLPQAGFDIAKIVDFSPAERKEQFLEGTGSLVLDRVNGIAYACLAPRTHPAVLDNFASSLDYKVVLFTAVDRQGQQIYHTNVLMCIGTGYSVICTQAIADEAERDQVLDSLHTTGHEIVDISYAQLEQFAGNMLELMSAEGDRLLAMSQRAADCLTAAQKEVLSQYVNIVSAPINVIEDNAGGSVRCMLAEVFLQKATDFS